jgi:hypothetical protein
MHNGNKISIDNSNQLIKRQLRRKPGVRRADPCCWLTASRSGASNLPLSPGRFNGNGRSEVRAHAAPWVKQLPVPKR